MNKKQSVSLIDGHIDGPTITDEEIINALKGNISNAKSVDCKVWSIELYKIENALDLINRQKSENKMYKSLYEDLKAEHLETIRLIKKAQSDAIKEFWDKLKQEADFISGGDYGFSFEIREDVANDIIEEMAGK